MQSLERILNRAVVNLSRDAAAETSSSANTARNSADFLSVLYPMPESSTLEPQTGVYQPITPAVAEKIAFNQVDLIDWILKKEMRLALGLADSRVAILNLTPFVLDYSPVLLKRIGHTLGSEAAVDWLAEMKKAAARIWTLGVSGLAPVGISKSEIESAYHAGQEWGGRKREYPVPSSDGNAKIGKDSTALSKNAQAILVILGWLPFHDGIECKLLASGQALARVNSKADTLGGSLSSQQLQKLGATMGVASFLQRDPMPLAEYWDAFSQYLGQRTPTAHIEPVTPIAYRELLELRQLARDRRIPYLRSYVGNHRVKAHDDDALAGNQPLFFRFAEAMLETAGQGIASLTAQPIFLDHPDMTRMRQNLLDSNDHIWIDSFSENRDGTFSSRFMRREEKTADIPAGEGNQLDLTLCTMHRASGSKKGDYELLYRTPKPSDSVPPSSEAHSVCDSFTQYHALQPNVANNYSFLPPKASREYLSWPSLVGIAAEAPLGGLMEKRGGALVDIDRERLETRMRGYFDKTLSWDRLVALGTALTEKQSRFDPKRTREIALEASGFHESSVKSYAAKPFDNRWCYHSLVKSLWSDPKPQFATLQGSGNRFIVARASKVIANEGIPFFLTSLLGDNDLLRGHTYYFPVWGIGNDGIQSANLSTRMMEYLTALGIFPATSSIEAARLVWHHVLAIEFSSAYLNENIEGIGQEWARIPFPSAHGDGETVARAKQALLESSRLGEAVANLLDLAVEAPGVTHGVLRPDFSSMAILWDARNDTPFNTGEPPEVAVNTEWGKLSGEKAVLPSHGRLWWRGFTSDESSCLEDGAWLDGVRAGAAYACLGDETYDIYLNDEVGVWNIPAKVWGFTVGGYQVLKKWLSYRETAILGRPLTLDEVELFCQIVRRIAALLLLGPRLNRNYSVIRDLHKAF